MPLHFLQWLILADGGTPPRLGLMNEGRTSRLTEHYRFGLLDRLSESSHRIMDEASIQFLRGIEEIHQKRGSQWATVTKRWKVQ